MVRLSGGEAGTPGKPLVRQLELYDTGVTTINGCTKKVESEETALAQSITNQDLDLLLTSGQIRQASRSPPQVGVLGRSKGEPMSTCGHRNPWDNGNYDESAGTLTVGGIYADWTSPLWMRRRTPRTAANTARPAG